MRYIFYICINLVGCRISIIYIQILYLHVRLLYLPCYELWTVFHLLCEAYHSESTFSLYSYLIALLEEMLPWFEDVDRLIAVICMSERITLHAVNKELVILDVDLDSTVAEVVQKQKQIRFFLPFLNNKFTRFYSSIICCHVSYF